jgi:predicted transcriptional regulator of viral defense system
MRNRQNALRKDRLGALEQRFLAYTQMKRLAVLRFGELRQALSLDSVQEKRALSRLARSGVIVRLKRGVYLFPPRLPLGGVWNPGEYAILRELMNACGNGRYQLCGWQTFNRYGFSEQVPTRIQAYNDRISGARTIAGQEFAFIRVSDARLGGAESVETPDGTEITMPTRARALMDAVYDWSRFGSLPAAYGWIREAVRKDRDMANALATVAIRYGNQATMRRIGFVLDGLAPAGTWEKRLRKAIRRSTALIPLVPGRAARGPANRKWGVIANE